ncbi:hypothetical protein HOK51_04365 [Candidatus Woesearchaeota archaeon]|jgi:sugar-specific transcriptional regulator TrmB|nr:hypothetical protein [Candidatus Woesearchaeota archaeon]MBT6519057.1 hypothetical protein [Candidatus Woesearchaeota archaeon]MBT7367326.1 hypothetical protein [Candidatus Woesearchaeota archaeon]
MTHRPYENLLRDIGLTDNEIKIYLTLLKLGISTSSKIVENANTSSGKIYETLNKLFNKGLVSISKINGIQHFESTHPNALIDFIDEQKKALDEKEKQLGTILPKLVELQQRPLVPFSSNVLTGTRSIKPLIIDLFAKSQKPICAMGLRGDKRSKYNNFWWHITENELEKKKKNANYLFSENKSDYFKKHKKLKNIETKHTESITPMAVDIIDDHVLLLTYEEDLKCVHIHNKAIAISFRSFFMTLWNQAKKYK